MNYENFATLVREYAKTNSTGLSDTKLATLANGIIEDWCNDIEESNPSYFEKVFSVNTVANQRNYDLDLAILSYLKKVEWKKDTASTTLYVPVLETNIDVLPTALQETEIRDYMSERNPRYGIRGGVLWLLTEEAILTVTDGLKIYANVYPQLIDSAWFAGTQKTDDMSKAQTTGAFGLPRQFHELLARAISIQYKTNLDRPMPLSMKEQAFFQDFAKKVHQTKKQIPSFVPARPYDDGSQY